MALANKRWGPWFGLLLLVVIFLFLMPSRANRNRRDPATKCLSSMKQICWAGWLWAGDHAGTFPTDFLSMSNELITPQILHCPADRKHRRAEDWQALSAAGLSYEMLSP